MSKRIYVINSRGEKELFSFEKVYNSAKRAGAKPSLAQRTAEIIKKEAIPGTKTFDIYRKVRKLLSKESPKSAIRFSLKEGMRKLGPSGFPFEKYIGKVLEREGFEVEINRHLPGRCVKNYETDFVARKGNIIYIGECKYRNKSGDRVHSYDALANYARFRDISAGPEFKAKKYRGCKIESMLVTNTKFTGRTKDYSSCVGVELLGWKYPENRGLERLIDEKGLYPITILPSFRENMRDIFVSRGIMLAGDILKIDPQDFSKQVRLPSGQIQSLIKEAKILLGNNYA